MRLETLAIGDELLTGKISDTNSAFVGAELFRRGLRLEGCQIVADDEAAMERILREAGERADYVVCFGGLGPTSDDKTALCVARMLGVDLVDDPGSMERLVVFAQKRNRELTPQLLKQVKHPKGTAVLPNSVGLAPGFSCKFGRATFFFLPGVPVEMKPMFLHHVLPGLEKAWVASGHPTYLSQVWKLLGIPESELQRLMDPVEAELPPHAWLGYRTKFPENHLVLYWRSGGAQDIAAFQKTAATIRAKVASLSYTEVDSELEEIVVELLRRKKYTIAFAESATAGLCMQRLARVSGVSDTLWGGAVVYQLTAKSVLLGVEEESEQAAVSEQCSRELALALRAKSGCAIAVGVTGYMGPATGNEGDPIGTTFVAIAGPTLLEKRLFASGSSREANQWGASTLVLNQLRLFLEAL